VKCVIVAAGMGLRLREIAPQKPLAPLLGEPLISRVIDCALAGGATEFVVVTGYEGAKLEKFLYSLAARRGIRLSCVRNPDWRGSNGLSVAAAGPVVSGEFLLLMSDHLFDPQIVRELLGAGLGGAAVVLAVDRRMDSPVVDLEDVTRVQVGPGDRIRRIGKLIGDYNGFDTGIFLASPLLIQAIEQSVAAGGVGSISEGMQRLADQGLAGSFDIGDRFWIDIDDPAAFGRAEKAAGHLMAAQ
jgi:1L-myo-inositol 1-phosphate cytidylyltransferase